MSEQERQQLAPPAPAAAPTAQKPHQKVPGLVELANQEHDEGDKKLVVRELIDALIAMRAPGDEEEEARTLVAHLDGKSLKGLVDDQNRDAHVEAVETLLSLGFPHALKVTWEDLDKMRKQRSLGGTVLARARRRSMAAAIAGASVAAGGAYTALVASQPTHALGFSTLAFGAAGAFTLWATRTRETVQAAATLLGLAAIQGFMAGAIDPPFFIASVGTAAALVLGRRGDPD